MKLTLLPLSTNYPIKVFNCVGLHEVHENETHDHVRNEGPGGGKEKKKGGGEICLSGSATAKVIA